MRISDHQVIGELLAGMNNATKFRSGINVAGARKAKWSITISTGTNGAVYSFYLGALLFSYTATSTNTTTIATAILSSLRNDIRFMSTYSFSSASNVIYVEALSYGAAYDFPMEDSDSKLAVARVTTGTDSEIIPFGVAVVKAGSPTHGVTPLALPTDAVLEAQSFELTFTNTENAVYPIAIVGPTGVVDVIATPMASTATTTQTNIVAALNAANIGDYFDFENGSSSTKINATAKTPGLTCDIQWQGQTVTVNAASLETDFNKILFGVTSRHDARPNGYPNKAEMECIYNDWVGVRIPISLSFSHGDKVWFNPTTSMFSNVYSSGYLFMKGWQFKKVATENVSNGRIAVIEYV